MEQVPLSQSVSVTQSLEGVFSRLDIAYRFAPEPLLGAQVNGKLFQQHVKAILEVEEQYIEPAELTDSKFNALQYAAGCVRQNLSQKFKKPTWKHPCCQDYLMCLTKMNKSTEGENEGMKENLCVKTMQLGLVIKLSNKTTNILHPNIQHSAVLQPYLTLSTMLLS